MDVYGGVRVLEPLPQTATAPQPRGPRVPGWVFALVGGLAVIVVFGFLAIDTVEVPERTQPTVPPSTIASPVEPDSFDFVPQPWALGYETRALPPIHWKPAKIATPGAAVTDVASRDGTLIAIGHSDDVAAGDGRTLAALWMSNAGTTWSPRTVATISDPGDVLFAVVAAGDDGFVVVGHDGGAMAMWTSPSGNRWTETFIDPAVTRTVAQSEWFGSAAKLHPVDVAVGDDAVLVLVEQWLTDAREFLVVDPSGSATAARVPDGATIEGVVFADGAFRAYGADCSGTECEAAVWSSTYGFSWHEATVEHPAGSNASVASVVHTEAGWAAVGNMVEPGWAADVVFVWLSDGGSIWTLAPDHGELFRASETELTLLLTEETAAGFRATVALDGTEFEVGTGDDINGQFVFTAIDGDRIVFGHSDPWGDVTQSTLGPGDSRAWSGSIEAKAITGEGDRLVIAGEVADGTIFGWRTIVWTSGDGGVTWRADELGSGLAINGALTHRGRPFLPGGAGNDPWVVGWIGTWDSTAARHGVAAVVRQMVLAVAAGNHPALVESLPPTIEPGGLEARIVWPVPLGMSMQAFYEPDELGEMRLNVPAVEGAADYAAALGGRLEVDECVVDLADPTGADATGKVWCPATYSDRLVETIYGEALEFTIEAQVEDGTLVDMTVVESDEAWMQFARWLQRSRPELADTIAVRTFDDSAGVAVPTGPGAAGRHLEAAEDLVAGWVREGSVTTVDSPFGSIAWSLVAPPSEWGEEISGPEWTEDGFTLVAHGATETTWRSADGRSWTRVEIPDRAQYVDGELDVSPAGRVITGWEPEEDRNYLRRQTGDGVWVDIEYLDEVADGDQWWVSGMAATEDVLVVTTVTWSEEQEEERRAWVWDDARAGLVAAQPPWLRGECCDELVSTGFGVVAMSWDWEGVGENPTIWVSQDGFSWQEVTPPPDRDLAEIRHVRAFGEGLIVVGQSTAESCRPVSWEGPTSEWCSPLAVVAVTADGVAWESAMPGPDVTVQNFAVIKDGPLGLAAWGWTSAWGSPWTTEGHEPGRATVWLSTDGLAWAPVALEFPWSSVDTNRELGGVAIGEHAIVAAIMEAHPGETSRAPILLVGTLAEASDEPPLRPR